MEFQIYPFNPIWVFGRTFLWPKENFKALPTLRKGPFKKANPKTPFLPPIMVRKGGKKDKVLRVLNPPDRAL